MRLHRFFIENKLEVGKIEKISDDNLINQWRNVLRYQVGQEVILLDNTGFEFLGVFVSLGNRQAEIEIISKRQTAFSPRIPVFLFLALAKRDAFEWALEKGTEIGVAGFVPVISEHSEKKSLNLERSRLILKEACEQSGRGILPELFEPLKLEEALDQISGETLVLDPRGEKLEAKDFSGGKRVNVFIGPEGGWSKAEIELFKERQITAHSLGTQVLRFETAATAISSILIL